MKFLTLNSWFQGQKISFHRFTCNWFYVKFFYCLKSMWCNWWSDVIIIQNMRRYLINKVVKTVSNKTWLRGNILQCIVCFFYYRKERTNKRHIRNIPFLLHGHRIVNHLIAMDESNWIHCLTFFCKGIYLAERISLLFIVSVI